MTPRLRTVLDERMEVPLGTYNSLNIRYDLSINSTKLIRVNSTKYLGVFIDEDLTWQNHIHYIINKLVKFRSIFYKLKSIVPSSIFRELYFALVHPTLYMALKSTQIHINNTSIL